MPRYYDDASWSQSPADRLRAAKARLDDARARLERSRERLTATPTETRVTIEDGESPDPASSYNYMAADLRKRFPKSESQSLRSDPLELVLRNDVARRMHWERYLADFQAYVLAKLEYERLERDTGGANGGTSLPRRAAPPGPAAEPDPWIQEQQEACRQLRQASDVLEKKRTRAAIAEALAAAALGQSYGGDECGGLVGRTVATAGVVAEELAQQAREAFRQRCTTKNYRRWLDARADAQFLGQSSEGVQFPHVDSQVLARRREPGGRYRIQPGDTLSKLAKRFYGEAWLWCVLFEHNMGVTLPDNPDLLLPGVMEIEIP